MEAGSLTTSSGSSSRYNDNAIIANQSLLRGGGGIGMKLDNPFTFKVGQVFTGFGVGCGIGIGVGRPINLGAVPMVGQLMSATRGATDAFSGVAGHVNSTLRKVGAKNIEAGIGCGIGFGHGFGVGLAVKPSALKQVQICVVQVLAKMMTKFGISPNMSLGQGSLPMSLQSGMGMMNEQSSANPMGNIMQMATAIPGQTFQGQPSDRNFNAISTYENSPFNDTPVDPPFGTRTEKVLNNFLQNPVLRGEKTEASELSGRLQTENSMLQMMLKHQQVIEELIEENEKLRQILVEDLKVPPSKLQASSPSKSKSTCSDCFECRRKQRRR